MLDNIRARLSAAPKSTTKELDDSFPTHMSDVWRIVEQSAREARISQNCSARPQYVATVYNLAHAVFYSEAPRDMQYLFNEIERLRGIIEQAAGAVQALQAMTAVTDGDLAKQDADMAYAHATELGDRLWQELEK